MTRFRAPRTDRGRVLSGSGVSIRRESELAIDVKAALDVVAPLAAGEVLRQNDRGTDREGQPFRPYSESYKRQLRKKGEDPSRVDHRVTGRLLGSVGERFRKLRKGGGQVGIGPSATFAVIGAALQRLRLWLGLAPDGRKRIARALEKAKIFASVRPR